MDLGEKKWYAIHVLSGHENRVKAYLENEIKRVGLEEKVSSILIPSEEIMEMKDGKKKVKTKVFFPGYMLIEAVIDKESLHLITNTPGVTKFVGANKKPIPARDSEIKKIIHRTQAKAAKVELDVKIGDKVRIISGPFADFVGDITEVYPDKAKLRASVSIFGRDTPVELEYNQIQKV